MKHSTAEDAIAQIKAKSYPDKYHVENKPIYLIGISFDTTRKTVIDLLYEHHS